MSLYLPLLLHSFSAISKKTTKSLLKALFTIAETYFKNLSFFKYTNKGYVSKPIINDKKNTGKFYLILL